MTTINVNLENYPLPWFSNAGLNPAFPFGDQDGIEPMVVASESETLSLIWNLNIQDYRVISVIRHSKP